MTAEPARLLGRALGQTPQYWLNLQAAYDRGDAFDVEIVDYH